MHFLNSSLVTTFDLMMAEIEMRKGRKMLSFTWLLLHNTLLCFDWHYYIICDTCDCIHNGDEPPNDSQLWGFL